MYLQPKKDVTVYCNGNGFSGLNKLLRHVLSLAGVVTNTNDLTQCLQGTKGQPGLKKKYAVFSVCVISESTPPAP